MTIEVCQTQTGESSMSEDFLLPLVPGSFFSPPSGTSFLWYAIQVWTSVSSLSTDGADGIYKASHGGSVTGCCTSTHCRRTCLLSHLLERLLQSRSATGQCCCHQCRAGTVSCDCCESWEQLGKKSRSRLLSIPALTIFFGCSWSSHHPMLRRSCGEPGTCSGLCPARQLGRASGEWKVTTNSPRLALVSSHSLVKAFIMVNAIMLNTNGVNDFPCIGQHYPEPWSHRETIKAISAV